MRYFKFIRNQAVVDLLHYEKAPVYIKFQMAHAVPVRCGLKDAQGIMSDNEKIYHTSAFLPFPVPDKYPTVTMEEITENEYDQLLNKNFKSADQIREELLLEMMERGIL